ncbi:MAG: tRNA (N6-isopentenyl adenosine(37)-C2)-methylthiotransferase MiaB [Candidatus Geothermincolia bacterium]
MDKTFLLKTYGCQMNRHDSERLAGLLEAAGWRQVADLELARAVIFMTCCVRAGAEERIYGLLGNYMTWKRELPGRLLAVGGCMAQKEGERLLARVPYIDLVFGTHQFTHIAVLLEECREERASVTALTGVELDGLPVARRESFRAWVPVTSGCDNHCSYCIVPSVRGPERSRGMDEILREVDALARDGVLEINLLGQNVNSYGRDLYGEPSFDRLLRAVDERHPELWVRFVTSHPRDFSDAIIDAIAECPSVCEYVHLPLQAGSDRILALMGRGYGRDYYLERLERLRAHVGECAVSTDLLLGFPGETEEDFAETLEAARLAAFDNAFTFIYSPREGTPAALLPERLTDDEKRDRFDRLQEVLHASTEHGNRRWEGRDLEVIVEGPSAKNPEMLTGRTRAWRIVNFPGPAALAGSKAVVRVARARLWSLEGELLGRAGGIIPVRP